MLLSSESVVLVNPKKQSPELLGSPSASDTTTFPRIRHPDLGKLQ